MFVFYSKLKYMSKLGVKNKFVDVSDYGRPVAKLIAEALKNTRVTAIHITLLFGISGILAIVYMLKSQFWLAGFFLILKSILDAADGQLARVKNEPSYSGRYLDSIFDSLLNFALIISIAVFTGTNTWLALLAYICMQTQGTVYNYYHVIFRHHTAGEITSQIFEDEVPKAYVGESQASVNILYLLFRVLYKVFDKFVYTIDPRASIQAECPKWFMFLVSFYGLGFQLLIIAVFMAVGWIGMIIPFFIAYSVFIPVFIGIRRVYLR